MHQTRTTRQRHRRAQRGMSLIEVLISTGLLVGGGGALLVGMSQGFLLVNFLTEQQVALQAAQGMLEELAAADFDELATSNNVLLGAARGTAGAGVCMGEDKNCDGIISPGEVDTNGNGRADRVLPTGRLNFRIRAIPGEALSTATQVDLIVSASWRSGRRCIGGEDRNCSGVLDAGEDANGNGWMDTPVMVSTRVSRKN